ncbi:VgrG protein [Minicystis rosea]|nr:VgrG protein [Minicystis rosea]
MEVVLESAQFDTSNVRVHTLSGREGISRLFAFDVGIVSTDTEEPNADTMAGAEVSLIFLRDGIEVRKVHGMIAEVHETLETEVEHRSYRLKIVPRAFRLTLVETQEIYMHQSVPEIIQHKLDLCGLGPSDVEMRLLGKYPKLEFVVQYRESDLAFISRLTEHAGISFFFEHEGHDKIVFTDHTTGFRALEEPLTFHPRGENRDITRIESTTRLSPSMYVVQDYNYRTPQVELTGMVEVPSGFGGGIVEYGAHVKSPETAAALAQIRAEELSCRRRVFEGDSASCLLGAGTRFRLDGHARLTDGGFLVTDIEHHLTQSVLTHGHGSGGDAKPSYRGTFNATSAKLTFRPARVTPKPRIHGVLTGVVEQDPADPVGQYAKIDDHGRYTIKLLFDTTAPGQRKASRPIRMIQPHVGADYGMHFPLKPGVEVLLVFADGDPDRPLIVGAVPNPETPSPVTSVNSLANRLKTASGVLVEMKDI